MKFSIISYEYPEEFSAIVHCPDKPYFSEGDYTVIYVRKSPIDDRVDCLYLDCEVPPTRIASWLTLTDEFLGVAPETFPLCVVEVIHGMAIDIISEIEKANGCPFSGNLDFDIVVSEDEKDLK